MKLGRIREVKVPITVVLGETELSIAEVSQFVEGKIIKLESFAGEPVDVLAAGQRVARGEVVVIDENFGVRITGLVEIEE